MMGAAWSLARPLFHALDPERAHDLTLAALARLPLPAATAGRSAPRGAGVRPPFRQPGRTRRRVRQERRDGSHRAGALGFGFAEVGTLTPLRARR